MKKLLVLLFVFLQLEQSSPVRNCVLSHVWIKKDAEMMNLDLQSLKKVEIIPMKQFQNSGIFYCLKWFQLLRKLWNVMNMNIWMWHCLILTHFRMVLMLEMIYFNLNKLWPNKTKFGLTANWIIHFLCESNVFSSHIAKTQ